jgi:hypothetical protein
MHRKTKQNKGPALYWWQRLTMVQAGKKVKNITQFGYSGSVVFFISEIFIK